MLSPFLAPPPPPFLVKTSHPPLQPSLKNLIPLLYEEGGGGGVWTMGNIKMKII